MSSRVQLSRILSAVEKVLLDASDRELTSRKETDAAERRVRNAITSRIEALGKGSSNRIPEDISERRTLLSLVMRGSNIPTELRMAFEDGDDISDAEVSLLLRKLIRSGLLAGARPKRN